MKKLFFLLLALSVIGCGYEESPSSDTGASETSSNPFALANAVFWADGGDSSGTWDAATGTATVLKAGEPYQVNSSFRPVSVTAGIVKTVTFSCTGGNTVTVTLKEDGGTYTTYATSEVACDGDKSVVLTPSVTDAAAQLAFNFGKAVGTYVLSDISV
ncbi:hypothetical protein HY798_00290 [Candidatus Falkowbacteria bacterium]|nr:hypothetical protein [Candidatus Falkowbacteria bacterium]